MKYTLEDIHNIDLDLVKQFVKICDEFNFKYYIIGGTLLGAIRHKGFIPWDDDMDIAMPREDFERFLNVANNELPSNMKLITFRNQESYRYYLPRIVDLNTEIVEKRYVDSGEKSNLFIDIFPIDGTPNNKLLRKLYYFRILYNRLMVSWYYIDTIDPSRKRNLIEKILIVAGKILPTKIIINPKKHLEKIDSLMKKNKIESSKYIGTIMGAYRTREIVPRSYFGMPTKYDFEDMQLTGPQQYNEYLTHMYGDYMKIPKDISTNSHYE